MNEPELDALAKQKRERNRVLSELLAPQKNHPDRNNKSAEALKEAIKNAPPHKNLKVYKDEYDKNADEIISLAFFLPEHQFKRV